MEDNVTQQILDELKDIKNSQAKLEIGQAKLEAGQSKLEKDVRDIFLKLENIVEPSIQALHEGHAAHTEIIRRIESKVDRLEMKVDNLDTYVIVHDEKLKKLAQ